MSLFVPGSWDFTPDLFASLGIFVIFLVVGWILTYR